MDKGFPWLDRCNWCQKSITQYQSWIWSRGLAYHASGSDSSRGNCYAEWIKYQRQVREQAKRGKM